MGNKTTFGTARDIALRIIQQNTPYYSEALLQLVPEDLLAVELTDKNFFSVSNQVNKICSQKQEELAKMLGLPDDWTKEENQREKWRKAVNSKLGTLPEKQERKRKEIKFLFSLAATIAHR